MILSSSLLFPPFLEVRVEDQDVNDLAGVYTKTNQERDFRPVYRNKENYIIYDSKKSKNINHSR